MLIPLAGAPAMAQIIVGAGGDLASAVEAATSGAVIELQSSETYDVTLGLGYIGAKDLTLRAGEGFAPTIRGVDGPAIFGLTEDQQLDFEGIAFESGGGLLDASIYFSGSLGATEQQRLRFVNCSFDETFVVSASSFGQLQVTLQNCEYTGDNFSISASGLTQLDLLVSDCDLARFSASTSGEGQASISLRDSVVHGSSEVIIARDGLATLERCRFEDTVDLLGETVPSLSGPEVTLRMRNCLVVGDDATGLDGVDIDSVNNNGFLVAEMRHCTVVGFDVGLDVPSISLFGALQPSGDLSVTGCVFANNGLDIDGPVAGQLIQESIITTPSGISGSGVVSGPASLTSDFALVQGSLGTDASILSGSFAGSTDFYGNPRSVDLDFDGAAVPNLGAIEVPTSSFASTFVFPGLNPLALEVPPPVLGQTLQAKVDLGLAGVASALAIGQPSGTLSQVPGLLGFVLLDLGQSIEFIVGLDTYPIQVPYESALLGAKVSVQGVRVDLPFLTTQMLNRCDLTFGF